MDYARRKVRKNFRRKSRKFPEKFLIVIAGWKMNRKE
jgi:hypothetical protein